MNWMEVGAEPPYDIIGAMPMRGVTLTEIACQEMGAGEWQRVFSGRARGRAPFRLEVASRALGLDVAFDPHAVRIQVGAAADLDVAVDRGAAHVAVTVDLVGEGGGGGQCAAEVEPDEAERSLHGGFL